MKLLRISLKKNNIIAFAKFHQPLLDLEFCLTLEGISTVDLMLVPFLMDMVEDSFLISFIWKKSFRERSKR